MGRKRAPKAPENGGNGLHAWLGAALAIGRDHLGLSLKDACRQLAGVSDKTLMKWETGDRLQPLSYAIELARRDEVTRSMLLQALGKGRPVAGSAGPRLARPGWSSSRCAWTAPRASRTEKAILPHDPGDARIGAPTIPEA
jgi:hypothetical protein